MDAPARAIPVDPNTMRPGFIRRLTALSIIPANVMGAVTVYFYYNYVDPLGGGPPPDATYAFAVFLAVVIPLVGSTGISAHAGCGRCARGAGGSAPAPTPTRCRRRSGAAR